MEEAAIGNMKGVRCNSIVVIGRVAPQASCNVGQCPGQGVNIQLVQFSEDVVAEQLRGLI